LLILSDKAFLSLVRMCDMITFACLQMVNCDFFNVTFSKTATAVQNKHYFSLNDRQGILCV